VPKEADDPTLQPRPALPALPEGHPRVLVVDDHPGARHAWLAMAKRLGWQAVACATADEALQLLGDQWRAGDPYRAVFVDDRMPGTDGWEVCLKIRQLMCHESVPASTTAVVLMHTPCSSGAFAPPSPNEHKLIDAVVVKPLVPTALVQGWREALALIGSAPVEPAANLDPHAPPAPVAPVAAPAPSALQQVQPLRGLRLLLVEDNAINQMVAEGLLTAQGALVDIAVNGLLGVEAVAAAIESGQPYDLVLMDMQMPVMDGLTATREIRSMAAAARMPIVAMTANAMAIDRDACLEAGMNDHLSKPFDLAKVVKTLLQWTAKPHEHRLP
jgi:CheY-like chemotaxis protein